MTIDSPPAWSPGPRRRSAPVRSPSTSATSTATRLPRRSVTVETQDSTSPPRSPRPRRDMPWSATLPLQPHGHQPLRPLTWTLEDGPTGMVLDPTTNALIWTPTPDQANTPRPSSSRSRTPRQARTNRLHGRRGGDDLPPQSPEPSPRAGAGVAYAYQVQADSPDGFYPLNYSVTTSPANVDITINSSTGLLQWPSPTLGSESVTVGVSDFVGLSATQTYTLVISSTSPGRPPTFNPPRAAAVCRRRLRLLVARRQ